MNKFWNWTKDVATGERVLRLEGMITDDDFWAWLTDGKTAKEFKEELNAGTGDITVWINSEGGDCFAAAQIYNALRDYRGKVTVKIDALAASAASVVAMAGDVIEISPVGLIMIHNPFSYTEGDAAEMRAAAYMLDEVKETAINAYELKTKLPRKKLAQMMDDETFMHAQAAIELGFADRIIGEANQQASQAKMSSRRQVMNSLATALKIARRDENNVLPKEDTDAEKLRRRLYLY